MRTYLEYTDFLNIAIKELGFIGSYNINSKGFFDLSEDEIILSTNKAKEISERKKLEVKIAEAKAYLEATDFKVLPDYDEDVTEVKLKRKEAREFIRANDIKLGIALL
jgi:hypothetical protein